MQAFTFIDDTKKVLDAAHRATVRALKVAGYAIFRTAQQSIQTSPKPSAPGEPPHSRRGLLRRAERYEVDDQAETAVIGPRFALVGTSAEAHEFGGQYKRETFQARPSIGPALQQNVSKLPAYFSGQVTSE